MSCKVPGKANRKGISTNQFFKMFPDNTSAEAWLIKARWPKEMACPKCGSLRVKDGQKHKSQPFRCMDCRGRFSVKTGTPMQDSNLGYRDWLYAIYLLTTNLKSVASMKLHRELGITQKAAWHLAHRVRKGWGGESQAEFEGPVEADESYFGGKRQNMSKSKRAILDGRGAVGKTAVVAVKDRPSKKVRAQVVEKTDASTLQGFVLDSIVPGTTVFTDEARAYEALPNREAVAHSLFEYVRGSVHTNGVESFWSMLKRAHMGTFHRLSPHHLHRYVSEFAGRHNMRGLDTLAQMAAVVRLMDGHRLRYRDLVA